MGSGLAWWGMAAVGPKTLPCFRLAGAPTRPPFCLPAPNAWQMEPPGFQAIYLPWADDIRSPETDTSFTGVEVRGASC